MSRSRESVDDVRATAAWVVERTLAARAPVDNFLVGALQRFDERDRALLREIVLGTLRWLRRLDDIIERAASRKLAEIDAGLVAILRVAAYQLFFLDRVPPHAVVNEAVEQSRRSSHRGGTSFVNAVLRRIAREPSLSAWPVDSGEPIARLAIEMSHPEVLVRRWVGQFGWDAASDLLAANNRPKPMHLLAFRGRGGRELLAEELIDEGIEVTPSRLSPVGLTVLQGNPLGTEAFRRGAFYVQDEASQAAALLPPPAPGERIWDAAAAPGGKSFAMLAVEPSVRIVASDAAAARLITVRANARRLGFPLHLAAADAGSPPFARAFDRVVVDLPCSGSGTLRKHPELKWRWSESELARLAGQAVRLLLGAANGVRPGGLLVAITCSLEPEENEGVAERFLRERPEFSRRDFAAAVEPTIAASILAPGLWRLPTGDDHDGFTVQVFERGRRGA